MEGNLLIRWVALYALVSVWRGAERKKHAHARSLHLVRLWRGEARRWARRA
jgi:hypothetical protein